MSYTGHGGKKLVRRIIDDLDEAKDRIQGLPNIEVGGRIARECIDIGYGFFTPLEGFMVESEVASVCENMELNDGTLWPIPILFDIGENKLEEKAIEEGESVLLTYRDSPLAVLEVDDIFSFDKMKIAESTLGTKSDEHPGVRMIKDFEDNFIGGKVTLVNKPDFNPPFDQFWYPPRKARGLFEEKGWKKTAAFQTRNVPHTGHEWLMKGSWFSANDAMSVEELQSGILVSSIIGPKRVGDYIDEAIIQTQQELQDAGYFRSDIHAVSFILWDMRYAGPKEAIFHAILRTNLGCTHHMFGRDHAGVGDFYDPWDAHKIFDNVGDEELDIEPIRCLWWWYCPACGEVTYGGLCGHDEAKQQFSGTLIRSMIKDKVQPTNSIMRPEVYDKMWEAADRYGFGSPFCTEEYLENRQPVFKLPDL